MDVTIKTLTPLWTGGIESSKVDRIHETGILGGLRWWYEAIMRGLGGIVTDPTQGERRGFDKEKYNKSTASDEYTRLEEAGLCAASQLFGTTGWQRQFRLRVSGQHTLAWNNRVALNIKPPGRTRGWFLNAGMVGELTLTLHGDDDSLARITRLLQFLELWGSLGAKPQLGYGVFQIISIQGTPKSFIWKPQYDIGEQPGIFPDLRTFTFFKLYFTPARADWWHEISGLRALRSRREAWTILERLGAQGMVPITPALKNYLRFHQNWSSNQLAHWLFGTLRKDERLRSKMSVSWAYRQNDSDTWEIRGWFYVPQDVIGRKVRNEVMRVFRENLEQPYNWPQMLGLPATAFQSAQVICAPATTPWQQHTSQTIADFLNREGAGDD